ncbi:MAG: hypothetical protein Q7R92_02385 [bacterium]|nr:hypothetical protein [bacterium]
MQDQLQKAINLAKKTGDRLIVFDSSKPDNIFMILALKDYENLVLGKSEVRGLTEDELLDKINRDIAIWKSEQDFDVNLGNFENIKIQADEADDKKPEAIGQIIKKAKRGWSIPPKRKSLAEEIIEEDRQYLEDVTF